MLRKRYSMGKQSCRVQKPMQNQMDFVKSGSELSEESVLLVEILLFQLIRLKNFIALLVEEGLACWNQPLAGTKHPMPTGAMS
jgi:hypothetical protein